MADFNPAAGQIRNTWQPTPLVPAQTAWHDHEMVSEDITVDLGTIDSESLTTSGQRPIGSPSKINYDGGVNVEWDVEGHIHYLANLQKHSATPVNPTGSVYEHKLAPSETDVDFENLMTLELWKDDDRGMILSDVRCNSASFDVSPEGFVTGTIGLAVGRHQYFTNVTQNAGTSTDPVIRGWPNYTVESGTDRVLWLEAIGVAAGVVTVEANLNNDTGTPPATGGTTFAVTAGNNSQGQAIYEEVILSDGSRLGKRDLPVEIHIPDVTGIIAGDQWYFTLERGVWVAALPSVPKLNEIYCSIAIGATFATAEVYEIDSFSWEVTRPAEPKHAIGGRFPKRTKERGQRTVGGSFTREYLDTSLVKRLEAGETGWLIWDAWSGEEIATNYEYRLRAVFGAVLLGGSLPSIGGQDSMGEQYDFTAHPSGDATYGDDVTLTAWNTIADLTA